MIDVPVMSSESDDYLDVIAHNYEQFMRYLDLLLEEEEDSRYLEECNRFHVLLNRMIAENFLED